MMNEFGTPMNDAEMNMLPPGANKPHERMLADSGMEMQLLPAIVGAIGVGGAAWLGMGAAATTAAVEGASAVGAGRGYMHHSGSQKAADAAGDAAQQQNLATERRYQYDMELWRMKKTQLQDE